MTETRTPPAGALKIVVLTTSYPRYPGDYAGTFVAAAVRHLLELGHRIEVVSPQDFRHFGIAYGYGVVGNLRRRPWRLLLLPLMLLNFRRAARRAVRGADLVHAYWLPSGAVALGLGRPIVLQLPGTDILLARRLRFFSRPVLRRAAAVICPSNELAEEARRLGAVRVQVISPEFTVPEQTKEEIEPETVLFVGRLSPEKGILELLEAARGLNLVVAGDGPLRKKVPQALGFVSYEKIGDLYDKAAVVACPSSREGFGMVCAEAMAHGRAVVACPVGGLRDLVVEDETGLFVPFGDAVALRAALEKLLADRELRRRMGAAGRKRILELFTWGPMLDRLLETYELAAGDRKDVSR
ncbi:MAG: glycosyltransferase family 4 protein [Gaiellaceae bacterium]|jgi:glycosyltransferase involved in cell wall biosynthesis